MVIKRLRGYRDSTGRIRGPGFYLFSIRKGKLLGGPFPTLFLAQQREKQVNAFRYMR